MAQQLYRTLTGQSTKSQGSTQSTPAAAPAVAGNQSLSRTSTNPLSGKLNHLTDEQETKLEQFKTKLQEGKWWTPDGVNGKPSHDDGTLLRYLRARKFDVDGAFGQFTDTEKWMKDTHVEELYENFDVQFYERARKMYPQWTGHRDRRGIPIYVYEIKGLDSKSVSKYQKESETYKAKLPQHKDLKQQSKLLPLFALYHNLLNFVLPLCSTLERPNPEIPVTNSTNIVDISGVGLTQFWNLKQHMQDASVLATAHYPETLDRIFIIGAPAFFPTVWGWIKRWFDPVTVSKIFILGKNEVKPTLESFMDPKDFPKKYGGELEWSWGDLPHMGPAELAAVEQDGNKGWIEGPCVWLEGKRVVVGSVEGKSRRDEKEVAEKKPVVYAADYTELPVHPDRKASVTSKKSLPANGIAAEPLSPVQSTQEVVPATSVPKDVEKPTTPTTTRDISNLNIKNSPMGDSQVHLPDEQANPPSQTAEYISPVNSTTPAGDGQTAAVSAAAITTATTSSAPAVAVAAATSGASISSQPPPGHTQPGPLTEHQAGVNKVIASQLAAESVSIIPASSGANGDLAHPEVVISSDTSKGLAAETDKLALGEEQTGRPVMERFVTAQEIKH